MHVIFAHLMCPLHVGVYICVTCVYVFPMRQDVFHVFSSHVCVNVIACICVQRPPSQLACSGVEMYVRRYCIYECNASRYSI